MGRWCSNFAFIYSIDIYWALLVCQGTGLGARNIEEQSPQGKYTHQRIIKINVQLWLYRHRGGRVCGDLGGMKSFPEGVTGLTQEVVGEGDGRLTQAERTVCTIGPYSISSRESVCVQRSKRWSVWLEFPQDGHETEATHLAEPWGYMRPLLLCIWGVKENG